MKNTIALSVLLIIASACRCGSAECSRKRTFSPASAPCVMDPTGSAQTNHGKKPQNSRLFIPPTSKKQSDADLKNGDHKRQGQDASL